MSNTSISETTFTCDNPTIRSLHLEQTSSGKMFISITLLTILLHIISISAYPQQFYQHDNCLYAYIDDTGSYSISFPDGAESQKGSLKMPAYETKKSKCTKGAEPGLLSVRFDTADNNMNSISIDFNIEPSPAAGYWEVNRATMNIQPTGNTALFPNLTIELKPIDIYASDHFSYSCNLLVLQNLYTTGPQFKIILRKFQIQPFAESERTKFAPSYDCSVWLTLPLIMGMILILFIIFTVLIGVYLLVRQGNQSENLKFIKQSDVHFSLG